MASELLIKGKIERFTDECLLPAYREIKESLEKRGDSATILAYNSESCKLTNYILHIMNRSFWQMASLYEFFPSDDEIAENVEDEAAYVGHSLYVVRAGPHDAPDGDRLLGGESGSVIVRADADDDPDGDEGKFIVSARFRITPANEVYVAPTVCYFMAFNHKLHIFNHRYDADIADHRVEDVTRHHVLNHFLDSFDFFKMHAHDDVAPW